MQMGGGEAPDPQRGMLNASRTNPGSFPGSGDLLPLRLDKMVFGLTFEITMDKQQKPKTPQVLDRYSRNLTQLARAGRLDPVIGRESEIRRLIEVLSRRTKNNPVLIGEPGVGKTAIAEGLALRIVKKDTPAVLWNKKMVALDLPALVAGASLMGAFENRLRAVIKEVRDSDGHILLFIDELHNLVGAGKTEGAMDAAQILKPALARGELRVIGATTLDEYRKFIEKDKALERRFQTVMVKEPDQDSALTILRGLKEKYENYHGVRIKDSALQAAVRLSSRYINGRFLPDKAIDLIDESASRLNIEIHSVPTEIDEVQRKITHLLVEQKALRKEAAGDPCTRDRLQTLQKELETLNTRHNRLKKQWEQEKTKIVLVQKLKTQMEELRIQKDKAFREGKLDKVAEIQYGKLPQLKKQLQQGAKGAKPLAEKHHSLDEASSQEGAKPLAESSSPLGENKSPPRKRGSSDASFGKTQGVDSRLRGNDDSISGNEGISGNDDACGKDGTHNKKDMACGSVPVSSEAKVLPLLKEEVGPEEVAGAVFRWTGIPVHKMLESEADKLLNMEKRLKQKVVGQDRAARVVAQALRRSRAGLSDPLRPIGSFIFLGPTGVGKTEMARALAELLFDSKNHLIRIDMSEYMEKHQVSRLVGAPPGYVGHEEGGQLSEAVRRQPYSVILLDELEKAHPEVSHILLQVLDSGHLTDSQGRKISFKNTLLIMTSNIGSPVASDSHLSPFKKREKVLNILKQHFRPEFLNRVDDIVTFNPLSEKSIHEVVQIQIREIQKRMEDKKVSLFVDTKAVQFLSRLGFDPEYGARPVRRVLQKELLNPLSVQWMENKLKTGGRVKVTTARQDLGLAFHS